MLSYRFLPNEIYSPHLSKSIRYLSECEIERTGSPSTVEAVCNSPIFILSSGWRCGSTLIQRLVCSDPDVLIWGEPFGDTAPVCRMASLLVGMNEESAHWKYAINGKGENLSDEWIANLNPGKEPIRNAHRAYFEEMFAKPAIRRGFSRWGAKWVRLSADHAWYLKWLYPEAKFIFLVRNPVNAYQSYRGKKWFTIKPDYPMNSIWKFMAHWGYLAKSFLSEKDELSAYCVRYEDLVANPDAISNLENYLSIEIKRDVLNKKIGSRSRKHSLLSHWWAKTVCQMICMRPLEEFQYN